VCSKWRIEKTSIRHAPFPFLPRYRPLELAKNRVTTLDGGVHRSLRCLLAIQGRFVFLGPDITDLHEVTKAQTAGVCGWFLVVQLQQRCLKERLVLVEAGVLDLGIGSLGDWQITGFCVEFHLTIRVRQEGKELRDAFVLGGILATHDPE
jgi:hypothetical protein